MLTGLLAGRTQATGAGLPAPSDVPTVAEMGFKDFETSQWYGILAPAGTLREIIKRLQQESLKALKSNSVTERFASDSAVGGGRPPDAFAIYIAQHRGNAALCAAPTAREAGASVLLLEAAPRAWRGGNSMHARDIRCMHDAQLRCGRRRLRVQPCLVAPGLGSERTRRVAGRPVCNLRHTRECRELGHHG